mmetsp:Transcript_19347/g.29137  ORF Transcript_19347/g.29137 Transcript_19347/m.29137 type:complete len:116 (+) Transcript_19347:19-366(+)
MTNDQAAFQFATLTRNPYDKMLCKGMSHQSLQPFITPRQFPVTSPIISTSSLFVSPSSLYSASSDEVEAAAALILPLLAYKVAASYYGNQLQWYLDAAISLALAAFAFLLFNTMS